jgi:hypothetical protein
MILERKKLKLIYISLSTVFIVLVCLPTGAVLEDREAVTNPQPRQIRENISNREGLKEEICRDTGISISKLDTFDPLLSLLVYQRGNPTSIANLVRTSLEIGCTDECLREMLRSMTYLIGHGYSGSDAQIMVCETLKTYVRERPIEGWSDQEHAREVRRHIEELAGLSIWPIH